MRCGLTWTWPSLALWVPGPTSAELGWIGERIAARYLIRRGARIVARRWRSRAMEVDLLIADGDGWACVEVKTGRLGYVFRPGDRLDPQRMHRLQRAARSLGHLSGRTVRVDLLEVLLTSRGRLLRVVHSPNLAPDRSPWGDRGLVRDSGTKAPPGPFPSGRFHPMG